MNGINRSMLSTSIRSLLSNKIKQKLESFPTSVFQTFKHLFLYKCQDESCLFKPVHYNIQTFQEISIISYKGLLIFTVGSQQRTIFGKNPCHNN